MSTVYTVNGKVLKNASNDKWLIKKEAPAGFVMNASNVVNSSGNWFTWQSPGFADNYYNGNGKTLQIIIKEAGCTFASLRLYYANTASSSGPDAIPQWYNPSATTPGYDAECSPGTYTFTMNNNPYPPESWSGKYLVLSYGGPTIDYQTWLSKIELRIID